MSAPPSPQLLVRRVQELQVRLYGQHERLGLSYRIVAIVA